MACNTIMEFNKNKGYYVTHLNGQRKIGPPMDWIGAPPPKGSEVFIGKLPRDVSENDLVPLFSRFGKIYTLRMMLNILGTCRGYAFLSYCSRSEATAAISKLHNYELKPGIRIAVVRSVDNCRLYLGGIPKNKTRTDILEEMSIHVNGIVDALVYKNCFDRRYNRGFAFLEFSSHHEAATARQIMIQKSLKLWKHDVVVEWADPEPEVEEEVLRKVKILFVRNLCINTPQDKIKELFERTIQFPLERVKKIYDYAFIHFYKREQAEFALTHLNNFELDGLQIEIKWARPVDKKVYKLQKNVRGNSKFNISTATFKKAILLYEKENNENIKFEYSSLDEGIESAETSDSYSVTHKEIAPQNSSHIYPENPVTTLEELCKSFNWPSPTYELEEFLQPDGAHKYMCKVQFGHISPVMGPPGWTVVSSPSLTAEDAQHNAVCSALAMIKMYQQNEVYSGPYAAQISYLNMLQLMSIPAIPPWHPGLYTNPTLGTQIW